ncbi:hypothetical protein CHARACLAT_009711 [Characodon lateralis]|uniref:Uncharacterized protein n=1 Tax=Characodon lateralis TaxID=208331 RepID=A0ABU7EJ28_9TELE|nr:hypothetical protein [Characodon lateralis]
MALNGKTLVYFTSYPAFNPFNISLLLARDVCSRGVPETPGSCCFFRGAVRSSLFTCAFEEVGERRSKHGNLEIASQKPASDQDV